MLVSGDLEYADSVGRRVQALSGFLRGSKGEGQEAGAEPGELQGQWGDAGGVWQEQSGRAMMWERTELLMQGRESAQQSASGDSLCVGKLACEAERNVLK